MVRKAGYIWGIMGVLAILGFAIERVSKFALMPMDVELSVLAWVALFTWCLFMIYSEGYKALHKQFGPKVIRRAGYILRSGTLVDTVLAPLYCMGFFRATYKEGATAYGTTTGIVLLLAGVRLLPQPWRVVIDAGVVLGLACGMVSIVYLWVQTLRGHIAILDSNIPHGSENLTDTK